MSIWNNIKNRYHYWETLLRTLMSRRERVAGAGRARGSGPRRSWRAPRTTSCGGWRWRGWRPASRSPSRARPGTGGRTSSRCISTGDSKQQRISVRFIYQWMKIVDWFNTVKKQNCMMKTFGTNISSAKISGQLIEAQYVMLNCTQ